MKAMVYALLAIVVAISVSTFYRVEQGRANRANNAKVWHAVICSLEVATLNSKTATPARIKAAIRLYDELLIEDVHTSGCGLLKPKK